MPISIDIPLASSSDDFEPVFGFLTEIDNQFSTYKPGSEVSRYINEELDETELSADLKSVITACKDAESKTSGYFSAWASETFDPSGYVKGWAIAEAGKFLKEQGFRTYCIGAGGDILARSDSEKVWNIGIQDPEKKLEILCTLSISNGAVATSGNYERGAHIINPKTKQPAKELLSVSITGPDIIWADILATAVFAMGSNGDQLIKLHPSYSLLMVDKAGLSHTSPGWPSRSPESSR